MENLKMLPEYLFTVGHSMQQEIARDDFPLLNGVDAAAACSTEKDMCSALMYRIQNTSASLNTTGANLSKQVNNDNNAEESFVSVKLEDINAMDLFSPQTSNWPQHNVSTSPDTEGQQRMFPNSSNRFSRTHNANLLLQGSEDPLISHGANNVLMHDDEHLADFVKGLSTQVDGNFKDNQEIASRLKSHKPTFPARPIKSGCSNLTKQQLKVKANLMSARNQQQEQCQNHSLSLNITKTAATPVNRKLQRTQKIKSKKGTALKLRFHHQALPAAYLSHYEATQGQQRVFKNYIKPQATSTKSTNNTQKPTQSRNSHENVRSWLQNIAKIQRTANASKESLLPKQKSTETLTSLNNTNDTFETATSELPSVDANNNSRIQNGNEKPSTTHNAQFVAEYNNRSNSKRSFYAELPFMGEITLDNCKPRRGRKPKKADICHLIYKNYGTIMPKQIKPETSNTDADNHTKKETVSEQPLNLCLRDQLNDSYSISSGDELSETNSSCPTPVRTPLDTVRDTLLANNMKNSLSNISEHNNEDNSKVVETAPIKPTASSVDKEMHPIAMYYQQLLESGALLHNSSAGQFKTIQKDNQLSLKIPLPSGLFRPQNANKPTPSSNAKDAESSEQLSSSLSKSMQSGDCCAVNQQQIAPQKRKRSAIFIPPMNVENPSNPATEVSICKFKFTGGSKPTLEEKKMISVDAGGNYRYYSGTGDKANRGYEYFPRESLQHTAGLLPGVNCTSQKPSATTSPKNLPSFSSDLYQLSEMPTSSVLSSIANTNSHASSALTATTTSYESTIVSNSLCSRT